MFRKQLTGEKYLFYVFICIMANLLESWYFGFNAEAMSRAEFLLDLLTTLPLTVLFVWFMFTNDLLTTINGVLAKEIIIVGYLVLYRLLLL